MSEEKSIVIYLTDFTGGGVERMRTYLSRSFAARGYRTTFVVNSASGVNIGLVPDGVRVVDLHASRSIIALPRLISFLRRERPDAFLVGMTHNNIIGLLARRLAGVATRVVISDHVELSLHFAKPETWQGRAIPFLSKFFYHWADGIVAVSEGVADDVAAVAHLPRDRITCIYNPVIDDTFAKRAGEPIEDDWFEETAIPVILSVGRLNEQKDFKTLLKAFKIIRSKRPARLMILGEGEQRSELEALIAELELAEDVRLPGFADNPLPLMRRAAVFVLSSNREGFGNVLVEALASGTPVVSTNCRSGPAEILENGKYGPLVPVADADALARAIEQTLEAPIDPVILRQRGMQFSLDRAAEKYLDLLFDRRAA